MGWRRRGTGARAIACSRGLPDDVCCALHEGKVRCFGTREVVVEACDVEDLAVGSHLLCVRRRDGDTLCRELRPVPPTEEGEPWGSCPPEDERWWDFWTEEDATACPPGRGAANPGSAPSSSR